MSEFDPQLDRVAIIAGGGSLPIELAERCKMRGIPAFILALKEDGDEALKGFDHTDIGVGQLGQVFRLAKERGIKHLIFAGSIKMRPDLLSMKLDWQTIKFLPRILPLMARGDNSLLTGLMNVIEERGITMVGAHEVAPELLANSGVIVGKKPSKKTMANIALGFDAAKRLGGLDTGQGVVVENSRIIALEGAEGTDLMIKRVETLRQSGRLSTKIREGVLVKTMKPDQDMRADLPAIGPDTIRSVKAAGLTGIAIEAGKTIILQRDVCLSLAKSEGIFIYGADEQVLAESPGK